MADETSAAPVAESSLASEAPNSVETLAPEAASPVESAAPVAETTPVMMTVEGARAKITAALAGQVPQLALFQRTAQFTIPARNAPLDPAEQAAVKAEYAAFRERNRQMFGAFGSKFPKPVADAVDVDDEAFTTTMEWLWEQGGTMFLSGFRDLMRNPAANERAARIADPGFGRVFTDHMAIVRYDQANGWNAACVDARGNFPLDPATAVLHYAQEVFEGLKAYRHADGSIWLFRPERNAARRCSSSCSKASREKRSANSALLASSSITPGCLSR